MRISTARPRRALALLLGAAMSVTVASGAAAAAEIDAPYARAAAKVAANATLLHTKNVDSVTRGTGTSSPGVYCVEVRDRAVSDLETAAAVATLNDFRGEITAITVPHAYCGNEAGVITVVTSNSSGSPADRPFTVAVL